MGTTTSFPPLATFSCLAVLEPLPPLFPVHLSRWVGYHRANDKDLPRERNSPVLFLGYAGFLLVSPREEMQQSPPVRARVSYVTAPLLALSPSISHHIPLSRFHSTLSTNPIANGFCPLHQSCRKSRRLLARDGHMIERMCLLLQKRGTFGFAAPRKHPSQCQLQFFFKKNSYFHSSFYFSF